MYKVIKEFNSITKRVRIICLYNKFYKLQFAHSKIDPWTNKPKWSKWCSLIEENKLTDKILEEYNEQIKPLRRIKEE